MFILEIDFFFFWFEEMVFGFIFLWKFRSFQEHRTKQNTISKNIDRTLYLYLLTDVRCLWIYVCWMSHCLFITTIDISLTNNKPAYHSFYKNIVSKIFVYSDKYWYYLCDVSYGMRMPIMPYVNVYKLKRIFFMCGSS